MATVKCITIDSKNETLRYEHLDAREVSSRYRHDEILLKPNKSNNETVVLNFDDLTIEDPKQIPRHGFILWSQALRPRFKKKTYADSRCGVYPVIGDAVLVSYAKDGDDGYTAVDTKVTLEDAARLIVHYTNGAEEHLPEFTCMVTKCSSQPGYEILLRLENEGLPRWDNLSGPLAELDKPIQSLSPQVINFSFAGRDLTIMTGRILSLDEKVQVGIYESDRADMRCVGACTLAASKISEWVKNRLSDFYFNRIIAEPFVSELNFRQSMDEMHRSLGID